MNMTITSICEKYIIHLKNNYFPSKTVIIFYGYLQDSGNTTSTKSFERQRRSRKYIAASVVFDERTIITLSQESFLLNDKNKDLFIRILFRKLKDA